MPNAKWVVEIGTKNKITEPVSQKFWLRNDQEESKVELIRF